MIYFNCDYTQGAHPEILKALVKTNLVQTDGYGEDPYCEKARALIREACKAPEADIHFLVGGTQANFTVIRAALRPHQGVLCPVTGHINVHETGAVEATGHKVLALPCGREGKLCAAQIEAAVKSHYEDATHEHQVQPGMVYLSHPTETGALYTREELEKIGAVCEEWGLFLFVDGARLGYALTAQGTDVGLFDLARLCDVFYIGGTKCGALFGEAVVVLNPILKKDFRYFIKQGGGMLAKGRLLGLQFLTLLQEDLYFSICKKANLQAQKISSACQAAGFPMLAPSVTNQQFPILPDELLPLLGRDFTFSYWERVDSTHSAIRLCTSWATTDEETDALCSAILRLGKAL